MAGNVGESRGPGRNVVIVLMLLCVGCAAWIAVSFYRSSAAGEQAARNKSQIDQALPIAVEIVKLIGTETAPPPLTETELNSLINVTLNSTGLRWRSIIPSPPKPTDRRTIEYTRQIEIDDNDINAILNFLIALKSQRPDLVISRINLNAVGNSRRIWSGGLDITMSQKTG